MEVDEVRVTGEYVPLAFRGDTTEYNAAAFRVKPGAPAEELLKKLPGVEVDRAGNIKAMGEDVKKVMVDGKEFFGNDPKVATKNVPADALEKVQIYDRKSEETMFTGIYDGSREKTINLELKEDKKNGVFGSVTAGGGSGDHCLGNGRAYRFTSKTQAAVLGMANNVNQYGFSFDDYMNFSGGLASMVHGGGSAQIRITSDGSFPINFGQPIAGLNTSGAGGANFSYSKSTTDRAFISYLGTGTRQELLRNTTSRNFTEANPFLQTEDLDESGKTTAHRVNFGLRTRLDSLQNLVLDGNLSLSGGNNRRFSEVATSRGGQPVNTLDYRTTNTSERLSGDAAGSYTRKLKIGSSGRDLSILKISGSLSLSQSLTENDALSLTRLFSGTGWQENTANRFQDNQNDLFNGSAAVTFTQKIKGLLYLEPEVRAGITTESLDRTGGFPLAGNVPVDSLSPRYGRTYGFVRPGVSLIRNSDRFRFTVGLQFEGGRLAGSLDENGGVAGKLQEGVPMERNFRAFLPQFSVEHEYKTGRRLMAMLSSSINVPSAMQLLPVVNDINPLALFYGNPELDPERSHRMNLHWLLVDQFSFTSLMTTLSGTWTRDKINTARTIREDLSFVNRLVNVDNDYDARANADFSTPIRFIGMKVRINLEERWNRGINLINGTENITLNNTHRAGVTFDNRKKEKWDVSTGMEAAFTNSRYSVQQNLNNRYVDLSWFGEARYTPTVWWNFIVNADFTRYSDRGFGEQIDVPLLNAEISRFLFREQRATLTLRGFDLLNRNNIVQRLGEMNYLREVRSNSMGRYVLLTFTWRLNRFGTNTSAIDVRTR